MTATPGSVDETDGAGNSTSDSASVIATPIPSASRSSDPTIGSGLPQESTATNDDDDASDVSMSAETDDSDDDSQDGHHGASSRIISQHAAIQPLTTGLKRKLSSGQRISTDTQSWTMGRGEDHKRVKLDLGGDLALATYWDGNGRLRLNRSLLPAEIWHHIFTFTPPRALGRLLQVNKVFRAYLDPSSSANPHSLASLSKSLAQIRPPEAIWQASRRLFHPGMPPPLQGFSELDMWRLACTTTCQFCDRKGQLIPPNSADQWHSGPGENGVSPIWPFAIRCCGSCLQQRSIKEIDLLLSSSVPTPLMVALPFIFLTNDLHVLFPAILQHAQPPAHVQIVKYFFKSHVEDVKMEFFKVKALGSGAAEEWLKGLDERGKERRNDASRWERWEATGSVQRMQGSEKTEVHDLIRKPKAATTMSSTAPLDVTRPAPANILSRSQGGSNGSIQPEQSINAPFSTNTPPRFDSPAPNGFAPYPRPFQQPKHERTKEEVAELRAARRAAIEQRCMLLDPPLTPAVLSHMSSFQAAMQIIKPLDESAWEVLKPRLLSQVEEAQQRENDLVAQTRVVQEAYDERRQQDFSLKEVKEGNDREWDDIQAPLRARIGGYADETIRDGWLGGEKVTKESSPRFAAEVLIYVRKRFYAEVAKDEAAARAAGHEPKVDPLNGPFTQKLILENMKWVFDIKIKPLTEQYSKELFLCNGCENNFKFYGFEGVIQHYAAKHTSTLSQGSIVVHWKAEWPEYPPFNPDPDAVINSFHSAPKPNAMYGNGAATSHSHTFGGYPSVSGQAAAPIQSQQHSVGYQQTPVPYYGHTQFGDQFSRPQTGPFIPGPAIQGQSQGLPGSHYQGSHASGYQPYPGQGYPVQGFDGPYPNGASLAYDSPHPSQVYPVPVVEQPGQTYPLAVPFQGAGQYNAGQQYNSGHYGAGQYNSGPRPVVPVRTEEYKAQLHDIAQNAREVWNHTTGVKDMPGSVRVYVILYHILKRFRAKYPEDPPLAMVIDGLSNNKDMRPVRNVNGLACRACKLEKVNRNNNSHKAASKGPGANEKKLFSLPQLLNHFQSTHIEGTPSSIFDWTTDMVELPENTRISALAHAQGMDDHKMLLISEALPEAFRVSPPQAEHETPETYPLYSHEADEQAYGQLAPSRDDHHKYYVGESQGRYSVPSREQYDRSEGSAGELMQDAPVLVASSKRGHFEERQVEYQEPAPMTYIERRPASPSTPVRAVDEYGRHVVRDEDNFYPEPGTRNRDSNPGYRGRRARGSDIIPYDDQPRIEHGYVREVSLPRLLEMTDRLAATKVGARGHHVVHISNDHKPHGSTLSGPVPQSGPPPRTQQTPRADPVEGGSEDGELRAQTTPMPSSGNIPFSLEGASAAERFLNEFQPGESAEEYAKKAEEGERRNGDTLRARWEPERIEGMQRMHHPAEQRQRGHEVFVNDIRGAVISLPSASKDRSPAPLNNRPRHERPLPPHQVEAYDYDESYVRSAVEAPLPRACSPGIADHRYRVNNTIYRDARQTVHGTHSTASRFARYESVRVENDRARSRSPLYVKIGAHQGPYREQSPAPRYPQQEPLYRARTPQAPVQEISYERIPRQEYYRVYADEPRPRQPHHDAQVEYVQVADAQGDYLIRRPIRRDPEPVYGTYEDEPFPPRQAVYSTRAPVSRSDPAYYEEYDPRHPAPPPSTTIRQVRYQ